jgi:hypothetical protein
MNNMELLEKEAIGGVCDDLNFSLLTTHLDYPLIGK